MEVPKTYKTLFVVAKTREELWDILTEALKKTPNTKVQYNICRIYCGDYHDQSLSMSADFLSYESVTFLSLDSLDQIFLWSSGSAMSVDILICSKDEQFVQRIKDKYTYKREGIRSVELSDVLIPTTKYDM